MDPAASIVRLFGGPKAVAQIVGKHYSRVYRWTYSEADEGTGGLIPAREQVALLTYARANNIDLRPEDFFSADRLHRLEASKAEAVAP